MPSWHCSAFVRSDTPSLVAQTLALGLITVGTQIVVYGTVAALAVRARDPIRARQSLIARTMGGMLIVSALLTATRWGRAALPLIQEPKRLLQKRSAEPVQFGCPGTDSVGRYRTRGPLP
jgi:hypothetical protein